MADSYDQIQEHFLQMLQDSKHTFTTAATALVEGTDPMAIRQDVLTTDQRIDQTQQQLRRELVIHGTVHGATAFPSMLALMSLSKDVERIGDYAKNLLELCAIGGDLGGEQGRLAGLKDRVAGLLDQAGGIHKSQDQDKARTFLDDAGRIEQSCEERVRELLKQPGDNPSTAVLAYRYFKRVARHVGNVVTALVVPLDQLDVFDED